MLLTIRSEIVYQNPFKEHICSVAKVFWMIPPASCLPFCILMSPLVSRAKEMPKPSAHS